jgi:uncharacterized membrane protein
MNDWLLLAVSLLAFLVSHLIPVRPRVRRRLTNALGLTGFAVLYSFLSAAVFVWMILAAANAPYVELWSLENWQGWFALILMAFSILIASLSLGRANPLSIGRFGNPLDVSNPGILGWIRHPLLWAILLWSLAHLVANGDVAHVILFGFFSAVTLLGMVAIDRRRKREMGERWRELTLTLRANRSFSNLLRNSILRLGLVLVIYAALLVLHPVVLGVSPLAASGFSF